MDLQSVRSTAHRLYCQCQEERSSHYKSLARSVKKLRNELEDADEALTGTTFRAEDIRVLEAAGESKNALNKLDLLLQRDTAARESSADELDVIVADFIAEFAVVTHKLSEAIKDLEQADNKADTFLPVRPSHRRDVPLSPTSIGSLSRGTAGSHRSSTTSYSSCDQIRSSAEPKKMPAIAEQKVPTRGDSLSLEKRTSPVMLTPAQDDDQSTSPQSPASLATTSTTMLQPRDDDPNIVGEKVVSPADEFPTPPQCARSSDFPCDQSGSPVAADGTKEQAGTNAPEHLAPVDLRSLPIGLRRPLQGYVQPLLPQIAYPHQHRGQVAPDAARVLPVSPRPLDGNPDAMEPAPSELRGDPSASVGPDGCSGWQPTSPRLSDSLLADPSNTSPPHSASRADSYPSASLSLSLSNGSASGGILPNDLREDSQTSPAEAARHRTAPLDADDINRTINSWNQCDWSMAQLGLNALLSQALELQDQDLVRRAQHLLGILASVQGRFPQAHAYFLMVLRAPIVDYSHLDEGDCAAAYWLGDSYCMQNRRVEALTAYMIAEHSSLFRETQIRQQILAEQRACFAAFSTASKNDVKLNWDFEVRKVDRFTPDSMYNPELLSTTAESLLVTQGRIRAVAKKDSKQHVLDQHHSRVMAFRVLGADAGSFDLDYRLRIGPSAFDTSAPWPLMFDPYFAVANIVRGRMLLHRCDLLSQVRLNPSVNIPKAGRGRKTNFVSQDLQWLIVNIRECLTSASMQFSEILSPSDGFCFIACFAATEKEVASMHFLTISLFRQSFKHGFGVDIASDGLYSARIIRGDWLYDKGVPCKETERIRAMILEHLEIAVKCNGPALMGGGTDVASTKSHKKRSRFASTTSSMSSVPPSLSSS